MGMADLDTQTAKNNEAMRKLVISLLEKGLAMADTTVKYPCRGCIYFDACGHHNRTEPCDGRKTKQDQKKNIT